MRADLFIFFAINFTSLLGLVSDICPVSIFINSSNHNLVIQLKMLSSQIVCWCIWCDISINIKSLIFFDKPIQRSKPVFWFIWILVLLYYPCAFLWIGIRIIFFYQFFIFRLFYYKWHYLIIWPNRFLIFNSFWFISKLCFISKLSFTHYLWLFYIWNTNFTNWYWFIYCFCFI